MQLAVSRFLKSKSRISVLTFITWTTQLVYRDFKEIFQDLPRLLYVSPINKMFMFGCQETIEINTKHLEILLLLLSIQKYFMSCLWRFHLCLFLLGGVFWSCPCSRTWSFFCIWFCYRLFGFFFMYKWRSMWRRHCFCDRV